MPDNLIQELFEVLTKDKRKKKILGIIMEGGEDSEILDKILKTE